MKINPVSFLDRIIEDYIHMHRDRAKREMRWFALQPSIVKAIEMAALAKSPSGKRLAHQRRIPVSVLETSKKRLLEKSDLIEASETFNHLFSTVESIIRPIYGIGELTVYDTAVRIGAFLGVEPRQVFLHAGTREGARRLGLDSTRDHLKIEELPAPFLSLTPLEIEDVLCIYKMRLRRM